MWSVLNKYRPSRWTLQERAPSDAPEGYVGRTLWDLRLIVFPPLVNNTALGIALHECGHVCLGHSTADVYFRLEEEYEAEMWAWSKMREHGLRIPLYLRASFRGYAESLIGVGGNVGVPDHIVAQLDKLPSLSLSEQNKIFARTNWKHYEREIVGS